MIGIKDSKIRSVIAVLGTVSLMALAGCEDAPQRTTYNPPAGGGGVPTPAAAPTIIDTPPTTAPYDPLMAGGDPLTGGGDPLTSHGGAGGAYSHDPLTADADSQGNGLDKNANTARDALLSTPKMTTSHTHWLVGHIFNATVTVSINSIRLGTFNYPFSRNIDGRCRLGVNQVTFDYKPRTNTSSAQVNLLESEHNPAIAPLAEFDSPLSSTSHAVKPIVFKKVFIAK